jgi:hypothetical protein
MENKCPLWIDPGFIILSGKKKVAEVLYESVVSIFFVNAHQSR